MDEEDLFYGKKFQKLDGLINEILIDIHDRNSGYKQIKRFYDIVEYIHSPLKKLVESFERMRMTNTD